MILFHKFLQACHERKHRTCGGHSPKQSFIAMACNSKLHVIILWRVISMKLNIGMEITGFDIMTLNCKKISIFPNLYKSCLRGSYTVYRDVLENRQVGRAFKLVHPKNEDQVLVHNDSV